jgi:hypothetical protein
LNEASGSSVTRAGRADDRRGPRSQMHAQVVDSPSSTDKLLEASFLLRSNMV